MCSKACMNKLELIKNNEYRFKIMFNISMIITLFFAIYNFIMGLIYNYIWNISVSIYYLLLTLIRIYIEIIYLKKKDNKVHHIIQSIVLLLINESLLLPISLLVLNQKQVNNNSIMAITVATYTTYKIINSVLNYKKEQNENNIIKIIRTISLLDALFAILNLQNTLVVTFGQIEEMIILISISSFLIALLMIIISLKNLINNIKK